MRVILIGSRVIFLSSQNIFPVIEKEGVNVKPDLQSLVWVNQMYGLGMGNLYEIDITTGTATMMCFGLVGGNVGSAEYVYGAWPG